MKKFNLGQTVMTDGVQKIVLSNPIAHDIIKAKLKAHECGDWGDMTAEDIAINERALENGTSQMMSSWQLTPDIKIWIITERDQSVTTILLPSEY